MIGARMSKRRQQFGRLRKMFESKGIDVSNPGFYDQDAFKEAEESDPAFLENYAWFVRSLEFGNDYLSKAREKTVASAEFLRRELMEDGRKGACIDTSLVLGRILDRENVWNYVVKGTLSIRFSAQLGLTPVVFGAITDPSNPALAGHVWLVAPPFDIVDITVAYQSYSPGVYPHIPQSILAEGGSTISPRLEDLVDPDVIRQVVRKFGRGRQAIERIQPGLTSRIIQLCPLSVMRDGVEFRYVPCAVTALDGDLEEARNLVLSGQYPVQLYDKYLRTRND